MSNVETAVSNMMDQYNSDWREAELAIVRVKERRAIPGDAIRLAKVGLQDPESHQALLDRLSGVKELLRIAGSKTDFEAATKDFHEDVPRLQSEAALCDQDIQKLQKELAALEAEKKKLLAEEDGIRTKVRDMTMARAKLRSANVLPPHINDEIRNLMKSAHEPTKARQAELKQLISQLRADSNRLESQTDAAGEGDDEYRYFTPKLRNENLLEQLATSAAANPGHRGHDFWKSRNYSIGNWKSYEHWASSKAAEFSDELDRLTSEAEASIKDQIEKMSGFYAEAIE